MESSGNNISIGPVTITAPDISATIVSQPLPNYCSHCGKKIGDDWTFCAGCGRQVLVMSQPTITWAPFWQIPYPAFPVYPNWTTVGSGYADMTFTSQQTAHD